MLLSARHCELPASLFVFSFSLCLCHIILLITVFVCYSSRLTSIFALPFIDHVPLNE